jgi:polar amino acid transport system ATP-binding protein
MTVLENCIEAPVHVQKLVKAEATERATRLLGLVGLKGLEGRRPAQLSGGQQQRVAIARALALRPKVLLLDEVTSALDPEVVVEVLAVIREINTEFGLTILMVTHQMVFAREFSDRVCFFNDGQILEAGPPQQVFDQPEHPRTRQFIRSVLLGQ